MSSERHFAVRVDIKSLAANKDLPGHSLDYRDLKVEAPMLMEPSYDTHDEAAARVMDLMAHGREKKSRSIFLMVSIIKDLDIFITLRKGNTYGNRNGKSRPGKPENP